MEHTANQAVIRGTLLELPSFPMRITATGFTALF